MSLSLCVYALVSYRGLPALFQSERPGYNALYVLTSTCVSTTCLVQFISGAFEHSVLRVWEIYALENAVFFYIAVYGSYKP